MTFPIIQPTHGVETFVHGVDDGQFKQLPSIYAIEATSACNLQCPMCIRSANVIKHPKLLDLKLLELMASRGDFQGSSYIELQLSGEPTIHPKLARIIHMLKSEVGVLVGMSTHGLNMTKRMAPWFKQYTDGPKYTVADALRQLDALTISVDSADPETYSKMRHPAKLADLIAQLDFFFQEAAASNTLPFIELQLVESTVAEGSGNVEALTALAKEHGWLDYASIRTTADCFYEMSGRMPVGSMPRNSDLCINPWTDVNISQDGDVVSCCYIFDTNTTEVNYYGNLWNQSLAEIWNGPRVAAMRRDHLQQTMHDQCAKCYYKSPALIHHNIISRLIRSRSR